MGLACSLAFIHQSSKGRQIILIGKWGPYQCGMIMADAGLPPWLIAHAKRIKDFDAMLGAICWPLLYQQECRYRREQLPRMLQKESGRLEEYLDRGLTTDFNPEKPWGYLYYMGANDEEDSRVSRWCHSNFEPKADFIITGLALIASYLGGDAEVCMSSSSHLATSGMSVPHAGQSGHQRPH